MDLVHIRQDRLEVDLALVLKGVEPRGTGRRFGIGQQSLTRSGNCAAEQSRIEANI
jgi:hypothetical protein